MDIFQLDEGIAMPTCTCCKRKVLRVEKMTHWAKIGLVLEDYLYWTLCSRCYTELAMAVEKFTVKRLDALKKKYRPINDSPLVDLMGEENGS